MISRQAKYALRALIALARIKPGNAAQTSDIAAKEKIPKKFLEQILLRLKNQGMVQSRRGNRGGYALLKPASEITFAQVLRTIDGPMAPLPCLSIIAYARCEDCKDEHTCEIRRVFAQVIEPTREVLERITIADAAAGRSIDIDALPIEKQMA